MTKINKQRCLLFWRVRFEHFGWKDIPKASALQHVQTKKNFPRCFYGLREPHSDYAWAALVIIMLCPVGVFKSGP